MAFHNTALCDSAQQVTAHDTMLPAVAQLQATAGNGGLLAAHSCQVAGPISHPWVCTAVGLQMQIQGTPCNDRVHSAMKASPIQCAQPLRASTVLRSPTRIGTSIAQPIWVTEQHDASSTPCVNEVPHMPSTHCSSAVKQLDNPCGISNTLRVSGHDASVCVTLSPLPAPGCVCARPATPHLTTWRTAGALSVTDQPFVPAPTEALRQRKRKHREQLGSSNTGSETPSATCQECLTWRRCPGYSQDARPTDVMHPWLHPVQ